MLDIHSHIIPKIDDGAKNIEMSLKMLKMAEQDGVKYIAATPHYCRGYYENKYEDILTSVEALKSMAKMENIDIVIIPGQEIYIDSNTLELLNKGILGGLNKSKYILVEFPMDKLPEDALDILYEIRIKGLVPIVAHPERYMYIIDAPWKINKFVEEEILFQINTGSVKGIFGKEVKNTAEILIKSGLGHFLASDAHSTGTRCPGLREGLKLAEKYDSKFKKTFIENSITLLNDKDIYYTGEKIKARKGFAKFFQK